MAQISPLFSVVLPTYNRARMAEAAVRSVLAQTEGDFECFVVDDGSTDGTWEALNALPKDPRVRLMRMERNQGQHACRNAAIRQAGGRFITFLDSDDVYLPGRLAAFRKAIEARPSAGFWFSNAFLYRYGVIIGRLFDPAREIPEGKVPGWYAAGDRFLPYVTTNVAVRREAFERFGLFRQDLKILEDTELYARMLEGGLEVGAIREPLAIRRLHESQITRDHERDFLEFQLALKAGNPSPEELRRRSEEVALEVAEYLWKDRKNASARALLLRELGPRAKSTFLYKKTFLPAWLLALGKQLRRGYLLARHHPAWAPEDEQRAYEFIASLDASGSR